MPFLHQCSRFFKISCVTIISILIFVSCLSTIAEIRKDLSIYLFDQTEHSKDMVNTPETLYVHRDSPKQIQFNTGNRIATKQNAGIKMQGRLEYTNNTRWNTGNTIEKLQQERLKMVDDYCKAQKLTGEVKDVIIDYYNTTSYCVVPKVGCTYWKQMFHFMGDEKLRHRYKTPERIPRYQVHYYKNASFRSNRNSHKNNLSKFLGDTFRFMFVRDPYRRLLSAWIDKFLLPDFWFSKGPGIGKDLDFKVRDKFCYTNITFQHFLTFVTLDKHLKSPEKLDPHWVPYSTICNPCKMRPSFIGRMESFGEDSKFILSQMEKALRNNNVDNLTKQVLNGSANGAIGTGNESSFKDDCNDQTGFGKSSSMRVTTNSFEDNQKFTTQDGNVPKNWNSIYCKDRSVNEMKMLSDYNFGIFKMDKKRYDDCHVTKLLVAERLWQAFQINGHLPIQLPFPLTSWDPQQWNNAIRLAYSYWNENPRKRRIQQKLQTESLFHQAFDKVPLQTLKKIEYLYRHDFALFGYEPEPPALFSGRH